MSNEIETRRVAVAVVTPQGEPLSARLYDGDNVVPFDGRSEENALAFDQDTDDGESRQPKMLGYMEALRREANRPVFVRNGPLQFERSEHVDLGTPGQGVEWRSGQTIHVAANWATGEGCEPECVAHRIRKQEGHGVAALNVAVPRKLGKHGNEMYWVMAPFRKAKAHSKTYGEPWDKSRAESDAEEAHRG